MTPTRDWRVIADQDMRAIDWAAMRSDALQAEKRLVAVTKLASAALAKLSEDGWLLFGAHMLQPDVQLEFSEQVDDEGHPYFERAVS